MNRRAFITAISAAVTIQAAELPKPDKITLALESTEFGDTYTAEGATISEAKTSGPSGKTKALRRSSSFMTQGSNDIFA